MAIRTLSLKNTAVKTTFLSIILSICSTLVMSQAYADDLCYQYFDDAEYQAARDSCRSIAELGDAKAAFLLATIYYQGLDTPVNEARALFWDEIAAEKGHPEAAYRLALAYQLGQGVARNNAQARRWYMQAALARHPKAQKQLGAMFETGAAGETNLEKAFEWYLKAARQGLADAQLRAGTMLLQGSGTAQDETHALHWIRKAAEAGNANAQVALGVMLVQIDPGESVSWYERAVQQGNALAMHNLASMYYTGEGVQQNPELALALAERAVIAGDTAAKALLSRIQLDQQQQRIADLQAEKQRLAVQLQQVAVQHQQPDQPAAPAAEHTIALVSMPETAAGIPEQDAAVAAVETAQQPGVEEVVVPVVSTASGNHTDTQQADPTTTAVNPQFLPDGWIMQQPSDAYTIQLTNGPDEVGIHKYISKKGLPAEARYYRTQRDAGVFYVLIYGEYPTVASAREALQALPAAARRDHWIRNISTLQKHYRQP